MADFEINVTVKLDKDTLDVISGLLTRSGQGIIEMASPLITTPVQDAPAEQPASGKRSHHRAKKATTEIAPETTATPEPAATAEETDATPEVDPGIVSGEVLAGLKAKSIAFCKSDPTGKAKIADFLKAHKVERVSYLPVSLVVDFETLLAGTADDGII